MRIIIIFFSLLILVACQDDFLDRNPTTSIGPAVFFDTESDLELYTNGLYSYVPGTAVIQSDLLYSDNIETPVYNKFMSGERLVPASASDAGWNWSYLRSVNYFLANYHRAQVDEGIKNYYAAIARFFRAWFYFDMMKRFGDLPWHSNPLETNSPELYKARDPRTLITDSIIADIDFAIDWLSPGKNYSVITQSTALALKSRVCLHEGTYRKYHTELGLASTATELLEMCVDASDQLMKSGNYTVYNTGSKNDYGQIFITEVPNSEVILANTYSKELKRFHEANYMFHAASYITPGGMTKQFINSYLMRDGSFFSSISGYEKYTFYQETRNRDYRLEQTIRTPGYVRLNTTEKLLPDFNRASTGYQIIKFVTTKDQDAYNENINAVPIFRYSEVLLNYVEARAELGVLTNDDLNRSINLTRKRGGLPSLTKADIKLDPAIQILYPNVTNPEILEIRRERRIELAYEGFRWNDLMRWKSGALMAQRLEGMYFSQLGVQDLDGDGTNDFAIVKTEPGQKLPGITYYVLGTEKILTGGDKGNVLIQPYAIKTFNEDRDYLFPLPLNELTLNKNLKQNPGWNY